MRVLQLQIDLAILVWLATGFEVAGSGKAAKAAKACRH